MSDGGEYLKHKLDQLWKQVEELRARVEQLEAGGAPAPGPVEQPVLVPLSVTGGSQVNPAAVPSSQGGSSVARILKESGPLNVVDVNAALRSQGVNETVRDTLFNRLKPLMQKGEVDYDKETQKFSAR